MGKKIPLPELPANVSSRLSPTSSTAKRAEVDISTCLQHYYSPLASDYAVHLLHKSKWTQRKTTLFHLNTAVKMWKVGSRQGVWVQGDGNKGTAIRGRTRGWPRRSLGACRRSKWTQGQTERSLGACRRSKRTQRRLTRTRRRPRRSLGVKTDPRLAKNVISGLQKVEIDPRMAWGLPGWASCTCSLPPQTAAALSTVSGASLTTVTQSRC